MQKHFAGSEFWNKLTLGVLNKFKWYSPQFASDKDLGKMNPISPMLRISASTPRRDRSQSTVIFPAQKMVSLWKVFTVLMNSTCPIPGRVQGCRPLPPSFVRVYHSVVRSAFVRRSPAGGSTKYCRKFLVSMFSNVASFTYKLRDRLVPSKRNKSFISAAAATVEQWK